MKRFIFATIAASATIFFAAGCQEKNEMAPTETSDRNVITASIPEAITRVSMNAPADGKGLALAWEAGDELTVIGVNSTEQFTIADGFTAHNAQFNGTAVDGNSFTVIYPGQTYKTLDEINAVSYLEQKQTGNGNTDHLFYHAMVETSDYTSLDFSKARQNGVIKFLFQLPSEATVVESVTLSATDAVFYATNDLDGEKTNSLTLDLEDVDVSASEQMLTAYMMISWNDVALPAASKLTITVNMPDSKFEQVLTVPETGLTILSGKVNTFGLNDKSWTEPLFFGGNGTEADPYQIKSYTHLDNVRKVINAETKTWFVMVDDIDMAGKNWTMYNGSIENVYKYDFDGGNHTISNFTYKNTSGASFFGAMTGQSKVHDLKFNSVEISDDENAGDKGNSAAVVTYNLLGGSIIDNVDMTNVSITGNYSRSNNTGTGTIASRVYEGVIQNCDINYVTITGESIRVGGIAGVSAHADNKFLYNTIDNAALSGKGCVGGIVGRSSSTGAPTIKHCTFKTGADKYITCSETNVTYVDDNDNTKITENINIGGIIATTGGAVTIEGCTVEAVIRSSTYYTGGIVGYIKGSSSSSIKNCIVTNSNISSTLTHTGGIIGYAGSNCKLEIADCKVDATIGNTANVTTGVFTGGIVGAAGGEVNVKKCSMKGNIIATERAVGGIIGGTESSNTPVVNECAYLEGTIQGKYRNGGIVGYAPGSVIITNCYSSGILKGSGYSGGIVGFYEGKVTGKTISNCYSTMTNENTGNANAGIVGCFGSSNDATRDTQNIGTVTKCIAWNDNVAGTTRNTCGCIVGAAGRMSTLADNFYNPDMLTGFTKTAHENSDSNTPLETYDSYDGKAAGEGETVSSIAQTKLGWSGDIWDFTTALPTLKNLPK